MPARPDHSVCAAPQAVRLRKHQHDHGEQHGENRKDDDARDPSQAGSREHCHLLTGALAIKIHGEKSTRHRDNQHQGPRDG